MCHKLHNYNDHIIRSVDPHPCQLNYGTNLILAYLSVCRVVDTVA